MYVLFLNEMDSDGLEFCGVFSSIEKAKASLVLKYPNIVWHDALIPHYIQSGFVEHHTNYMIKHFPLDEFVVPYYMGEANL